MFAEMPDETWFGPANLRSKRRARRARAAAELLKHDRWICDIGCGAQYLKSFLPRGAVYLPADIEARTPDTEICDLDTGDLPARSLELCDVAVMLGVLSRLRRPQEALTMLRPRVEFLFLPFPSKERTFTRDGFDAMLSTAGFVEVDRYNGQLHMLRAMNPDFSDADRMRRDEARSRYRRRRSAIRDLWQRAYHHWRVR